MREEPRDRLLPSSQYLTVAKVAKILSVSEDTVIRQFSRLDGVIDLGTPETLHKRKKRLLRIPQCVLERYVAERQVRNRNHRSR